MALRATRGFPPNVGKSSSGSGSGGGTILVPTTVPTWYAPIEFNYTQFNGTAALVKSNTLATLVVRGTIEGLVIGTKVQWAGAGISSLQFSIGIAGDLAKYCSPFDGLAAAGTFGYSDTLQLESFAGAFTILISVVAVGANLNALTAGTGVVYIKGSQLTTP